MLPYFPNRRLIFPETENCLRMRIPSFVFILFADIFFLIISLLQGGVFRGWLAKKE